MAIASRPIFVTGATGSIGSRLAERFARSGQPVRVLVRDRTRLGWLNLSSNIEIVSGDLSKPESLRGCLDGCWLVYHCAAKLTGSNWEKYRAINVDGTKALLREAERAGTSRFVHVSTIGVYGCSEAENIREDFPWPKNDHPYFATKQEAERAAWDAAGRVPIAVARLGDVFGPGQFVWTVDLINKIRQGILVPMTDRDSGVFNPTYIDNALDALILMGEHPAAVSEAFNIVDGTPMLFSQYIRRLVKVTGKQTVAVPGAFLKAGAAVLMAFDLLWGREASAKPGDVDYLLHKGTVNGEKIRSRLGWRPQVDVGGAFRRTEEWLKREGYLA